VLARLGRGRVRRPPLAAGAAPAGSVSVVIPARDEAQRIGPCLDGLLADPDVLEVVVVDDGSVDGTAELAAARGARVVAAGEPPAGWVGKPWALQRGLEEARGDIVVSVDADTRPRVGLAGAAAAALGAAELAGGAPAAAPGGSSLAPGGPSPAPGGSSPAPGGPSPAPGGSSPAPSGPSLAPGGSSPAPSGSFPASGGGAPVLVSVGCRFVCDGAGERWLHPALLATLVYRYGPPDAETAVATSRLMINGQCTAVRRRALLDAGGYREAAGHMTDDAAFARALARRGWRVVFHDGGGLIDVDMHEGAAETWREWGRSIALPDVTAPAWRAADAAVVWLTLGLPWVRLATRRATRLDRTLLALRLVVTGALAPAYARRGVAYWLSPLADVPAAARLTWSAVRPSRRWRGRAYGSRTAGR
jgi:dolichol-phosphate mannosyltransferase